MGPTELPIPQIVEVIAEADALSSAVTVPIRYDCCTGQETFMKKFLTMKMIPASW